MKIINEIDKNITFWMKKYGFTILRFSLAVVFIWFGLLKVLGSSSAEELVQRTIFFFSHSWFIPILGLWEIIIGVCLLYKPLIRLGIGLMLPQMIGTFLPLIFLPKVMFTGNLFLLTLEGQYIIKNIVLLSAAIVIGSHVRDKKNN